MPAFGRNQRQQPSIPDFERQAHLRRHGGRAVVAPGHRFMIRLKNPVATIIPIKLDPDGRTGRAAVGQEAARVAAVLTLIRRRRARRISANRHPEGWHLSRGGSL
jgi:hypothetical protein